MIRKLFNNLKSGSDDCMDSPQLPNIKKVVFHIGLHKTGSTAIQHFLYLNELKLNRLGFYFPKTGRVFGEEVNTHNLAWQRNPHGLFRPDAGDWTELWNELPAVTQPTVVFSSEDFCHYKTDSIETLAKSFSKQFKEVIIYLRPIREMLASEYAHVVRIGRVWEPFSEWHVRRLTKDRQRYDYLQLLRNWKSMGFEINVRRYNKESFAKITLCQDFLQALGVSDEHLNNFDTSITRNVAQSAEELILCQEIIRQMMQDYNLNEEQRKLVLDFLQKNLRSVLPQHSYYRPFSPEEELQIFESQKPMYDQISEEFLDGNPLFAYPNVQGTYVSNLQDLAPSLLIKVFSRLLYLKDMSSKENTAKHGQKG